MKKRTLSDIAGKIGTHVCNLSNRSIILARENGLITHGQEQKSLAELKEADRIWSTPVPGVPCAESLW